MSAEELAKILDELGERLGPAGEHIFALAVRQKVIESSITLGIAGLVGLGMAVLLTVCIVLFIRYEPQGSYDYGPDWVFNGGALAIIVLVGVAVVFIVTLPTALNPEYAAIRDIVQAVKP